MRRDFPTPRVEFALYGAIAFLGVLPAIQTGEVIGEGVDLYGTLWFYWWVEDCFRALRNPGFTDLFFYPLGKDIFAHTGANILDALASMPFQWLFGRGYQKWFIAALLVANAATFRLLAQQVLGKSWAACAATVAWILNPYLLFEINCGRLTQAFLLFLPLAFWGALRMEEDRRWRWPLLVGAMTAAQAWTYWFMGWFMAFGLGWIFLWGLWKSEERSMLWKRQVVAAATCLLLVAPAVIAMAGAASRGEVPGLAAEGGLMDLPRLAGVNISQSLHGYDLAENMGSPMFGYLCWGLPTLAWALFGRGRMRWLPVLGISLAFAVGPSLDLGTERPPLKMAHYLVLYHKLPFFDRLWFPYRFLSVAFVPASLAIGFLWKSAEERWKPTAPRLLLALLLIPAVNAVEQGRYRLYPFVTRDMTPPEAVHWIAEEEGAILHLPFGITQPSIVWQTLHHQPLYGGMGENASLLWPEGFHMRLRNSFVRAVVAAVRNPWATRQSYEVDGEDYEYNPVQRRILQEEGFRWVVLHRDLAESDMVRWRIKGAPRTVEEVDEARLARLVGMLGPIQGVEGPLVIWDLLEEAEVPHALRPTPEKIADRAWANRPPANPLEDALRERGRLRNSVAPGMAPGARPGTREASEGGGEP